MFWPTVFPPRLTWLSVVFQLVGGGTLVANAMIFAMVADISPEEKRWDFYIYWSEGFHMKRGTDNMTRASKFFRLYGVGLLLDMVLSPASGALATIQPWWPARFGLIAFTMAILATIVVLPETFVKPVSLPSSLDQPTQIEEEEPEEEDDPVLYADVQKKTPLWRVNKVVSSLRDLRYLIATRQVLLLIPLLSVGQLYDQSAEFFLNYVSKRYDWRESQVNLCHKYIAKSGTRLTRCRTGGLLVDISQCCQLGAPEYNTSRCQ